MQITDSNGNVFETNTQSIVTAGTGPLTLQQDAAGNWVDSGTGNILLTAGSKPCTQCRHKMAEKEMQKWLYMIIAFLVVIALLKFILG